VIHRDLNGRIADHKVSPKDVALHSRTYENPVGVAYDGVFFDDVSGVAGSGETNTKITSLGRITISN
jgi:hypothetical protein